MLKAKQAKLVNKVGMSRLSQALRRDEGSRRFKDLSKPIIAPQQTNFVFWFSNQYSTHSDKVFKLDQFIVIEVN